MVFFKAQIPFCTIQGKAMKETEKDAQDLTYDMIIPAYDWSLNRMGSVEQRIDGLIGLVVTVTVAVPIAVGALSEDKIQIPGSTMVMALGLCALFLAIVAVGLGIFTRQTGFVRTTRLSTLNDKKWQSLPTTEFRKHHLNYAACYIDKNFDLTILRSRLADVMAVIFALEVAVGLWWAFLQLRA